MAHKLFFSHDWGLYSLMDEAYLHSKSLVGHFFYKIWDILCALTAYINLGNSVFGDKPWLIFVCAQCIETRQ